MGKETAWEGKSMVKEAAWGKKHHGKSSSMGKNAAWGSKQDGEQRWSWPTLTPAAPATAFDLALSVSVGAASRATTSQRCVSMRHDNRVRAALHRHAR